MKKIKGQPGLVKDTKTNAVLSVDHVGLAAYQKKMADAENHIHDRADINRLIEKVAELERRLNSLMVTTNRLGLYTLPIGGKG